MSLKSLALGFVILWFLLGGIAHFMFTDAEAGIVPAMFPDHRLLVLVSGFFELLGVAGMLMPWTREAAGWGLMALTIAVTPANVFMWRHAAFYPRVPEWALLARLPFQAVLLVLIGWATRRGGEIRKFPGARIARR